MSKIKICDREYNDNYTIATVSGYYTVKIKFTDKQVIIDPNEGVTKDIVLSTLGVKYDGDGYDNYEMKINKSVIRNGEPVEDDIDHICDYNLKYKATISDLEYIRDKFKYPKLRQRAIDELKRRKDEKEEYDRIHNDPYYGIDPWPDT